MWIYLCIKFIHFKSEYLISSINHWLIIHQRCLSFPSIKWNWNAVHHHGLLLILFNVINNFTVYFLLKEKENETSSKLFIIYLFILVKENQFVWKVNYLVKVCLELYSVFRLCFGCFLLTNFWCLNFCDQIFRRIFAG